MWLTLNSKVTFLLLICGLAVEGAAGNDLDLLGHDMMKNPTLEENLVYREKHHGNGVDTVLDLVRNKRQAERRHKRQAVKGGIQNLIIFS